MRPCCKARLILTGHAEKIGNDLHGEWERIVGNEMKMPTAIEAVEEQCAFSSDLRFEQCNAPRRENGLHQPAQPSVIGIVEA